MTPNRYRYFKVGLPELKAFRIHKTFGYTEWGAELLHKNRSPTYSKKNIQDLQTMAVSLHKASDLRSSFLPDVTLCIFIPYVPSEHIWAMSRLWQIVPLYNWESIKRLNKKDKYAKIYVQTNLVKISSHHLLFDFLYMSPCAF